MVGYFSESKAYRQLEKRTSKVTKSRDVLFIEKVITNSINNSNNGFVVEQKEEGEEVESVPKICFKENLDKTSCINDDAEKETSHNLSEDEEFHNVFESETDMVSSDDDDINGKESTI